MGIDPCKEGAAILDVGIAGALFGPRGPATHKYRAAGHRHVDRAANADAVGRRARVDGCMGIDDMNIGVAIGSPAVCLGRR